MHDECHNHSWLQAASANYNRKGDENEGEEEKIDRENNVGEMEDMETPKREENGGI